MQKGFQKDFITIEILYGQERERHKHRDVELLYMLEGEMALTLENETYILNQDDLILINSNKMHSVGRMLHTKKRGLCCSVKIAWSFLTDCAAAPDIMFWCSSFQDMENRKYDELRVVLKRMVKDYAVNKEPQLIQYSDYYRLVHILTNYFMVDQESPEGERGAASRLDDIKYYIGKNYDSDISLSALADYMGLSVSYVSKYFKKHFDRNFMDYLYEIRLQKAEAQLVESEDAITEIAFQNGFPNMAAFNKHFKEKYGMTPSEYRKNQKKQLADTQEERRSENVRAMEALADYLAISDVAERKEISEEEHEVAADVSVYREYAPIWNTCINLGPAEGLLDSDMQQSILYAKKYMGFRYGRFWSLFTSNMLIVGAKTHGSNRFNRLDRILNFLIANEITPVIELGEKQNRIQKTVSDYLKESDNVSLFQSYEEFLSVLEEMMQHFVSIYTEQQVNQWVFEIWDDRRVEVYRDKQPYTRLYSDIRDIIKRYAPKANVGGAGNYIGWHKKHTDEAIRMWIDNGVYPDFLTFTYSPYASGELQRERMSKRKSDEDDLSHTLDEVKRLMLQYGFPKRRVYISDWNMTRSSRNYFNDSLWKACYIVKCSIDNLGKVDALVYSQLQDITTDYFDDQQLLNGSGGLLTRDQIGKPAFLAMRLLRHLQKYLVKTGEDYIITRDEYGKITILMHNFIARNYMYFLKEEHENTLKDHYTYFQHQNKKTLHFKLENVVANATYELHHHLINRKYGSIMDEWAKFGFRENLYLDDIEYLKTITIPQIYSTNAAAKDAVLEFDVDLEPLEVRCISLRPIR